MTHTRIAHHERERDVMRERERERERERGRCGERKEMRNRKVTRERVRYVKKQILFFLELCYNAILKIELHCNTIAKKFAIISSSISRWRGFWSLKCQIFLTFGISILQC